jgi:hypothetical protein
MSLAQIPYAEVLQLSPEDKVFCGGKLSKEEDFQGNFCGVGGYLKMLQGSENNVMYSGKF